MIIDLILDRKGGSIIRHDHPAPKGAVATTSDYCPRYFYNEIMEWYDIYPELAGSIANALDGGTNEDVQAELCKYIDQNDYNTEIKKYVQSVEWV